MDTKPIGYVQLTNLAAATKLTAGNAPPAGTQYALIQAEAQNVRWRDDGANPSATVGMLLNAGDVMQYSGDLKAIAFIGAAAGAILNVSYYKSVGFTLFPEEAGAAPAPAKARGDRRAKRKARRKGRMGGGGA